MKFKHTVIYFIFTMLALSQSWAEVRVSFCQQLFRDNKSQYQVRLPSQISKKRALEEIQNLRMMTFNMRMFHFTENEGLIGDKPWDQIEVMGRNISNLQPDIMVLEEANPMAVERFQQRFLKDQYQLFTTFKNVENMGIVFAIKKDLPFLFKLDENSGIQWKDPLDQTIKPLFSKGIPGLQVFMEGETLPRFIVVGHHGKSKRDRKVSKSNIIDFDSELMREAQAEALARIISNYEKRFPMASIVLAGDFNMDFTESAMKPLQQNMKDSFEVSRKPVPPQLQVTHAFFTDKHRFLHKIDMILGTGRFRRAVVKSFVYFFKDQRGNMQWYPKTFEERERRPSDHQPVLVDLDFTTLFGLRRVWN